jgi:uncharacterized protein YfkK (UPF0435 family)
MTEKNDLKFKCEDLQTKLNRANLKLTDVEKFHEKVNNRIYSNENYLEC